MHFLYMFIRHPPNPTLFPYTTLFRSGVAPELAVRASRAAQGHIGLALRYATQERSEEHTSELQSRGHLVCRLLLEKKNERTTNMSHRNRCRHNNREALT